MPSGLAIALPFGQPSPPPLSPLDIMDLSSPSVPYQVHPPAVGWLVIGGVSRLARWEEQAWPQAAKGRSVLLLGFFIARL